MPPLPLGKRSQHGRTLTFTRYNNEDQRWWLVPIFFVPPFLHALQRKSTIIRRVREIRQMMDESFDCRHFPIPLETRWLALVLSSGMQLAKEKSALSNQDTKRFREDE